MGDGVADGVGSGVGEGVGSGVGEGVDSGVGDGAGEGVGAWVGSGVGATVGCGVGAAVGVGVATTSEDATLSLAALLEEVVVTLAAVEVDTSLSPMCLATFLTVGRSSSVI